MSNSALIVANLAEKRYLTVPAYDGRPETRKRLSQFPTMPKIDRQEDKTNRILSENDCVLAAFTINTFDKNFNDNNMRYYTRTTLGLNIQAVILMAKSVKRPTPYRVCPPPALPLLSPVSCFLLLISDLLLIILVAML